MRLPRKAISIIIASTCLLALIGTLPVSVFAAKPPLKIMLQTEQQFYTQSELVEISGNVTNNAGTPIAGAYVALEVVDPELSTVFLDIARSVGNGSFSDSFRLPSGAVVGRYEVYAVASRTDYRSASNQTSFIVGSTSGISFSAWTKKSSYMRYENATVYGKLLNNQTPVSEALITFTLIYPNQTVWLTCSNMTSSSGNATCQFYLPPTIPAGQYRVNATSYKPDLENQTMTTTFTILNQEPTVHQVTVTPQIIEKPGSTNIQANISDFEDDQNIRVICIVTNPNGATQLFNMSLAESLFSLHYDVSIDHPVGTYSLEMKAVDQDSGSSNFITSFEVVSYVAGGSVQGWVIDCSGQGIPDATITLSLQDAYLTTTNTTDVQGFYEFINSMPGSYHLISRAAEYASEIEEVEVLVSQTIIQNLTLSHLPVLKGMVTTQSGNPISNASILVLSETGPVGEGYTLLNGSYSTVISYAGAFLARASDPLYTPNSTIVTCQLDQVTYQSFSLTKNGKLICWIKDAIDETPILDATAILSNGENIQPRESNSSGCLIFDSVSPGNYTLLVTAPTYFSSWTSTTIYSNQTTTEQIELLPTGNVTGVVTDAGTLLPLQNAIVSLMDTRGVTLAAVRTNASGEYLFYLVKPDSYTLKVCAYGYNASSAAIYATAKSVLTVNFQLQPNVIYLSSEVSSPQFSRGENATFIITASNVHSQSIADNVTDLNVVIKGPNNETRLLNVTRQGDVFVSLYLIPSNETMGTWTAYTEVYDTFGNHAETIERLTIMEAFLMQFSLDRRIAIESEIISFTAHIQRFSDLTRYLNTTEVTAIVVIRDPQNSTVASFNLAASGNALTAEYNTTGLDKGAYVAYLTVSDNMGNSKTVSKSFAIVEDFEVSVLTNKNSYNRTETVHISGNVSYLNGTSIANTKVLITLVVKNYPRSFSVTTDSTGNFEHAFTPLGIDAGNYSATASCAKDGITRSSSAFFSIQGLALSPSRFTVAMSENSVNDFQIRILNTGQTMLTNISVSVSPYSIDGVSVTITTPPNTQLQPSSSTTFTFRVDAEEGATPSTEFNLTVVCEQGAVEFGIVIVNLYPATPVLQVTPQIVDISLAPAEYSTYTVILKNIGYKTLQNASLVPALSDWIMTTKKELGDVNPQEVLVFDITIHPSESTPIGLVEDRITITSENHTPVNIYILVKVTSAENGTLRFRVVDDAGIPVANARITLQYQGYWLQALMNRTNATGYCVFPSIYGGRYTYIVSAENHGTVSDTIIVQQGSTTHIEVTSPMQAMEVSFDVIPITVEDHYVIVLNMTFKTEGIPPPVLLPIPPSLRFEADRTKVVQEGYNSTMYFSLYNTGLISIFNVSIQPETPIPAGYQILLGDFGESMSIPEIQARQTVPVPCQLIVDPDILITELQHGIVARIRMEGYFIYFDDDQNSQKAKVTAEVLVQIIDEDQRRLCINPSVIWGLNVNTGVTFQVPLGFSPRTLPDVTITNCAEAEGVCLYRMAIGGGFTLGVDVLGALSGTGFLGARVLDLIDLGYFITYGGISPYGPIPRDPVYQPGWMDLLDVASPNSYQRVLLHELVEYYSTHDVKTWTYFEPGETAFLSSESWEFDLPTSWSDIFQQIIGVRLSLGFSASIGYIAFIYKWQYDLCPCSGFIPILMVDVDLASITLPIIGPRITAPVDEGIPPPCWWGDADSSVIPPPKVEPTPKPTPQKVVPPPVENFHEVVKLHISQEATLERDAFIATLQMTNKLGSSYIENVHVNLDIRFQNATNANYNFFVDVAELQGISGIGGTGKINPKTTSTVSWLIIPKPGAGGSTELGLYYHVQAHIMYSVNQAFYNLDSSNETINVKPQPLLVLDYYVPKEVVAGEPFKLGVRVTNVGHGIARNFQMDSAQPVIYENQANLVIDFALLGSFLQGQPVANSLRINFGNIEPGQIKMGYWVMISSMSGNFTSFDATFTHSSALGGMETSLIAEVNTHILMRDVVIDEMAFAFLVDTDHDAIANQVLDPSSGLSENVAQSEYNVAEQTQTSLTIQTQKMASTWIWIEVNASGYYDSNVAYIERSDGKLLDEQNYWTTNGKVIIVDDPEENYTIVFAIRDVAISDVATLWSKTIVGEGRDLNFTVAIQNNGFETESFNVTIHANHTQIAMLEVTVSSGATIYRNLTWTTTGFAKGSYILNVTALAILDDMNTTNNTFESGIIFLTIAGDVDGDRDVDIFDIVAMAGAYGSKQGQPKYKANYDIDGDGDIDIFDIVIAAGNYGRKWGAAYSAVFASIPDELGPTKNQTAPPTSNLEGVAKRVDSNAYPLLAFMIALIPFISASRATWHARRHRKARRKLETL